MGVCNPQRGHQKPRRQFPLAIGVSRSTVSELSCRTSSWCPRLLGGGEPSHIGIGDQNCQLGIQSRVKGESLFPALWDGLVLCRAQTTLPE